MRSKWLAACIVLTGLMVLGTGHKASAFTPGSGGHITDVTFTATPGLIGGYYITKNHMWPNGSGTGSDPEVNSHFAAPATVGATSVTLQYAPVGTETWANYQYNGGDVTTTGDNFSINPSSDYKYRLYYNGGSVDGYLSNVVEANISGVNTRFSGWTLDESVWPGIMLPWVGRQLEASFLVTDNDTETAVTGGLTYQWYRVNPLTYEKTAIPGATGTSYTTTMDDVGGYHLICRATGDGTTVGGFAQVRSTGGVVIPNKAYVDRITRHSFRLNLEKTVDALPLDTLTLSYQDPQTWQDVNIPVTAVTLIAPAIYELTAELPAVKESFYLRNASDTWRIAEDSEFEPGMVEEGVHFKLPSSWLLFLPAITTH